jgi:hypothetical protein
MLGNERGWINHYTFQGNTPHIGTLMEEQWEGVREGDRSSIAWVDITNDGTLDLLYGHSGGGMAIYTGDSITINVTEREMEHFQVYPNPGNGWLQIRSTADWKELKVYDAIGVMVYNETGGKRVGEINTHDWSSGVYMIEVNWGSKRRVERWVKW